MRWYWLILGSSLVVIAVAWRLALDRSEPRPRQICDKPQIEYLPVVSLGERLPREAVVADLVISNRGRQPLEITEIRTSCSCSVLEKKLNGASESVRELSISPETSTTLHFRTSIDVDQPGEYRNSVHFRTNDPAHPHGVITVTYFCSIGGVSSRPTKLQMGDIPHGSREAFQVEIIDPYHSSGSVLRVEAEDPHLISVHWTPRNELQERPSEARVLGVIDVHPKTDRLNQIRTSARVVFQDARLRAFEIPIVGRVVPSIETSPPAIVLPQRKAGQKYYEAICFVRGASNILSAQVVSASSGLNVELLPRPNSSVQPVRVVWVPSKDEPTGASRRRVIVSVKTGSVEHMIEIPVTCEHS